MVVFGDTEKNVRYDSGRCFGRAKAVFMVLKRYVLTHFQKGI